MIYVDMSILHNPDKGEYGDCFRACIASLLEMNIQNVPHFLDGENPYKWYEELSEWLGNMGLAYFEYPISEQGIDKWKELFKSIGVPVYHEICGASPRGNFNHSVIGCNGQVIFDPHPSRSGLETISSYGFIIKTCA